MSLIKLASQVIPGGVNSPVRAYGNVGFEPPFIRSAGGCYITDTDGNRFIDYVMSWGPLILGHAHPEVIEAVRDKALAGLSYGAPTEGEYELAKLITDMVPSIGKVRLVSSGTEAAMSAVRLARGYTDRDYIVKFRGNYHGHSDGLLVDSGSGLLTSGIPTSAGVPQSYADKTLVAEYNDLSSVSSLFNEYKGQIAAIIVEPVAANMGVVLPEPGFLEGLKQISHDDGALLIFDEVITGFRLAPGGAQELYGVMPDITVLGKITGGGMPLAAFGGRSDIMDHVAPAGPVYQAGTLSGNPVAVAAGLATLNIIRRSGQSLYDELAGKAMAIKEAFIRSASKAGIDIYVGQAGSLLSPFYGKRDVRNYSDASSSDEALFNRAFAWLFRNGIYVAPSRFEAMFLSIDHNDEVIGKTISVIERMWDQ